MKSKKKTQDVIFKTLMIACASLVIILLGLVLGYIITQGAGLINKRFLTGDFDAETKYVNVVTSDEGLSADIEVVTYDKSKYIAISKINKNSPLRDAITIDGQLYPLRAGDIIRKIDAENTVDMTVAEYETVQTALPKNSTVKLKITRPGEGVFPLAMNTLYIIGLSLLFALPMAIFFGHIPSRICQTRESAGNHSVRNQFVGRYSVHHLRALWHAGVC